MLRKLITLAVAGGLAHKAYGIYKERQAEAAEEEAMLAKLAAEIEPQGADADEGSGANAARKPSARGTRRSTRTRRSDGPSAH